VYVECTTEHWTSRRLLRPERQRRRSDTNRVWS